MSIGRRTFLQSALTVAATAGLSDRTSNAATPSSNAQQQMETGRQRVPRDRIDPWIEVDDRLLKANVKAIRQLTNNRSIVGVIKNNAYGLGLVATAKYLETLPEIVALAVVKVQSAIELREAGIKKPIHLMALFPKSAAKELAHHDIQPCLYSANALELVEPMYELLRRPVDVQVYVDTGMSRMGVPYRKALPWIEALAKSGTVSLQGAFMGFTEDAEFDREQLQRLQILAKEASQRGYNLGKLHAASSSAVFELPEAHLDFVRPGIAIFGGYPNDPVTQQKRARLQTAFSLKAQVVRVEQLQTGDSVSYGRNYIAEKPTWVATIPTGHTDGYPRKGVEGGRILIGSETYPVIGAVSASHTIVEVGAEKKVNVGDVATLMGSEHPEIDPNWLSSTTGVSVYDLFMHLNSSLPRYSA
ncbi:MAG: alanine racemase [Pirellulales bacterium]|nr:alanine racemase [Pirellulales bacterium]